MANNKHRRNGVAPREENVTKSEPGEDSAQANVRFSWFGGAGKVKGVNSADIVKIVGLLLMAGCVLYGMYVIKEAVRLALENK